MKQPPTHSSKELLVQKFGGSSLADVEKLQRVAQKIIATKQSGVDVVAVVSAMGGTTDELLEMAKQISPSPARRELDMLLSVGERISMALLSMALEQAGFQAVSLTGSQCGIITTDSHNDAQIIDVRPFRVQDELAKGKVVIVAGFQGTSYRREVTTLGRGGSDTTAVALAAALSATACEIYSDVDGIFSADPRVVLDAQKLESLTHEEMQELARSGARVLNEQAVEFARRKKIALYAKSAHDESSTGTVVRPDGADDVVPETVTAISQIAKGWWVTGETAPDVLEDVPCAFIQWDDTFRAFVLLDDLHETDALFNQLQTAWDVREAGLVSAVGLGIGKTTDVVRRGGDVVETKLGRFVGTHRVSWVVPCEDVAAVANGLHALFIAAT